MFGWINNWEGDELPEEGEPPRYDPSKDSPEARMYREEAKKFRDLPCKCGYYSTRGAVFCVKCERALDG